MEQRKPAAIRVPSVEPSPGRHPPTGTARTRSGVTGASAVLLVAAVVTGLLTVFTIMTHTEAVTARMHTLRTDYQILRAEPTASVHSDQLPPPSTVTSQTVTISEPESTIDISATRHQLEDRLLLEVNRLKAVVKDMRMNKRLVMPWNPEAIAMTNRLQAATRCYLSLLYGDIDKRIIVAMVLQFPDVMLKEHEWLRAEHTGGNITLLMELAPMRLLPHATFTVLEIARTFNRGNFHRNAGHVLQSQINCDFHGGLVFMEYDKSYRHEKYSFGFAGRGGGNALYINTENNTMTHGPGTDRGGKDPESDTVFAKLLSVAPVLQRGKKIVDIMRKQPGGEKPNGFISDNSNFIKILDIDALTDRDAWARAGVSYADLASGLDLAPEHVYYDRATHWRPLYGGTALSTGGGGSDASAGSAVEEALLPPRERDVCRPFIDAALPVQDK